MDNGGEIFDEGSEAVHGQTVIGAFASGFAADGWVRRACHDGAAFDLGGGFVVIVEQNGA